MSRRNPYAPPSSSHGHRGGRPAQAAVGPLTRLVHLFIDTAFSYLLFVALVTADYYVGSGILWEFSTSLSPFLVALTLFAAYYFLAEALFGRTVGKLITRTCVVDGSGRRAAVWRIAVRTGARLIPFDALSFLIPGKRGWHDALSGTFVVRPGDRRTRSNADDR